jgi:hypothetical protein
MGMLVVRYQGQPAAWVSADRIELYPRIAAFEADHPVRRWVMCTAIFAMEVLGGHIRGPFRQTRADHFARCALIPDAEFGPVQDAYDAAIAEHFNVPLEQIAGKRLDLLAVWLGEPGS